MMPAIIMKTLAAIVVLLAACQVQLGDGPGGGGNGVDAPGGGGDDGTTQIDAAPGIDAPMCANGRVVYLNFTGVTLTDSAASDATLNRASWITNIASGTAPAYKVGVSNRLQLIQDVTDGVRAQLASFPVTVVTTRPAIGPYVMIVLGGVASQVGSRFGSAVNELDCGDLQKSDVAWISDNVTPTQHVVNTAVGAIGFGLGLTATISTTDCMCGWDNGCSRNVNTACTLSPNINRDPSANQRCAGLTTQNEVATFDQAFCQ
jgi:hypothetical protein